MKDKLGSTKGPPKMDEQLEQRIAALPMYKSTKAYTTRKCW